MRNPLSLVASGLIAASLLALLCLAPVVIVALGQERTPLIVVTFNNLAYDVKLVADDYCRIVSLIPSGVEPHSYSLRPGDVEVLENASLIVSTLHVPVEARIDEMFSAGKLSAEYIAIPRIGGMKLLVNPNTGKINYHMIIYDPGNYKVFIVTLAHTLARVDPEHQREYQEKMSLILDRLSRNVEPYRNAIGLPAVASMPPTQYAVSWMGVRVLRFLEPEPNLGVSPRDLREVERLLSNGTAKLAVIMVKYEPLKGDLGPSSIVDQRLLELAERYQVPILRVPNPVSPGDIPGKLSFLVSQLGELGLGGSVKNTTTGGTGQTFPFLSGANVTRLLVIILVVAAVFIGYSVFRRLA